jgi:hypothetical protein
MIGNIPPFGSIALFRLHCNAISLRCLEARKREIDADLKAQQGDMEIAIHPNLPDLYRRKVARLQQVLDDDRSRVAWFGRVALGDGPLRGSAWKHAAAACGE